MVSDLVGKTGRICVNPGGCEQSPRDSGGCVEVDFTDGLEAAKATQHQFTPAEPAGVLTGPSYPKVRVGRRSVSGYIASPH